MPLDCTIEKVDLFLDAKDLPKLHTFNVTDAFAVLWSVDNLTKDLKKIGSTNVIGNNLNPSWSMSFNVDFMFEIQQEIVVKVFHAKDGQPIENESAHELIGDAKFELGRLMRASNQKLNLLLSGAHANGSSINVRGELVCNTRDLFRVSFSCNKLTNKDGFFGTSDPFYTISRMNEDGTLTSVYTSPRIDNTLSPRWGEIKLPMAQLCNNDLHRPLRIEVLDWDSNGKHDSMGVARTSVHAMLAANNAPMELTEKKPGHGTLVAGNASIEHRPTFAQFIAGGLDVDLTVAVDFTGSNGDPAQPGTLHFVDAVNAHVHNPYEQAISRVAGVLSAYTKTDEYRVLGFGARTRDEDGSYGNVQHCIPIGGGSVKGAGAVLEAYREALKTLMLSGPTLFAPLIATTANTVRAMGCRPDDQHYHVLLIITDGSVNDMPETINALLDASQLPMSVVIIGVGEADFDLMKVLDSDKGLLQSGGRTAERDIVQFVALKDNLARGLPVVVQQLLAEIPTQLLQYMEKRGIAPLPKK